MFCGFETGKFPSISFLKPGTVFSNDCNKLIRQMNGLVEKANYCKTASDCTILTETINGCWSFINKNADLTKIKEGNKKYGELNCPALIADCLIEPKPRDIKCKDNRCGL